MFKITAEWIHQFRSRSGGWNKPQLQAIGVSWPPRSGWIREVEGTEIPEVQRIRFERLQGKTRKVLRSEKAGQSPKEKLLSRKQQRIRDWMEQMVDVALTLSEKDRAELEAWELLNIDGHTVGTSDWPGWLRYLPPPPWKQL